VLFWKWVLILEGFEGESFEYEKRLTELDRSEFGVPEKFGALFDFCVYKAEFRAYKGEVLNWFFEPRTTRLN
jgi:hypothetical protein